MLVDGTPLNCNPSLAFPISPVQEFLVLGYSVLLSDVDIVTLKDPFPHLHRDHDIEALSDGFDPRTAYGKSLPLFPGSM